MTSKPDRGPVACEASTTNSTLRFLIRCEHEVMLTQETVPNHFPGAAVCAETSTVPGPPLESPTQFSVPRATVQALAGAGTVQVPTANNTVDPVESPACALTR